MYLNILNNIAYNLKKIKKKFLFQVDQFYLNKNYSNIDFYLYI